jgi:hypothetical protein
MITQTLAVNYRDRVRSLTRITVSSGADRHWPLKLS